MRNLFLILIILMSCISCKKNYTCECVQERRAFVFETTVIKVKEKNKQKALSECIKEYESMPDYAIPNYSEPTCSIK